MTAITAALPRHAAERAGWLAGGLAAAALARAALSGSTPLTAFAAGAGFGVALLCLALGGGWRPALPTGRGLGIGLAGGLVLVALPLVTHPVVRLAIGMRPEPFAAWVVVTALVAVSEEVLLRGALLDAVADAFGPWPAVAASSLAFGLLHVPLYGWAVVPVDIAAGIWLAGLRNVSGGVAAPALAHLIADLASWWL